MMNIHTLHEMINNARADAPSDTTLRCMYNDMVDSIIKDGHRTRKQTKSAIRAARADFIKTYALVCGSKAAVIRAICSLSCSYDAIDA